MPRPVPIFVKYHYEIPQRHSVTSQKVLTEMTEHFYKIGEYPRKSEVVIFNPFTQTICVWI